MKWGAYLTEGLRPVIDLVYPPRCPLCGDALADQGGLCGECWGELSIPGEPSCSSCGRPYDLGKSDDDARCFVCVANPPKHSGIAAATIYNDASRRLVLTYKHGRKIALASLLGRLLASRLPDANSEEDAALLIPVPLHRWRLWQRGFNQSGLLAQELEKRGKGQVLIDGLLRCKRTQSLGGMGAKARRKVLSGAITINSSRAHQISGREVILVDDVLTSGATSDACVEALLGAGASSVRIACFARVVKNEFDPSLQRVSKTLSIDETGPENITPGVITTPGAT